MELLRLIGHWVWYFLWLKVVLSSNFLYYRKFQEYGQNFGAYGQDWDERYLSVEGK
jgi:hypothetical protein